LIIRNTGFREAVFSFGISSYCIYLVTIQSIVSGAPLSAARILSITGKLFFLTVEMYALILQKVSTPF